MSERLDALGTAFGGYDNSPPAQSATRSQAEIARDRFWAARAAGDRRAMTYWSARENRLRRAAHGAPPAGARCLSWRGRDLPRLA
jgi:hypothetical protein